ncbi:chromosome segregation protein SMC [Alkalicoccus chagannorensis]
MFLKRLELAGFKSFADLVNIEFEDGVTAVVGPNGSGKSNISDAVRWVLGEQSARNLRGTRMEDVIFGGSQHRNRKQLAEISLVMNNESGQLPVDYTEVVITRRIHRSGDSEYLMNRQPCRLRDIHDLFLDSGLGRESFSIIGQGRVEEILSSKAEDRRAVFEEAAGVRRYKQRKQQSEKKLDDTEENLSRVRDILYELESQVEPLAEQASAAEEYKAQKAELKEIEAGVLVSEIEERHVSWKEEKEQLNQLERQRQHTGQRITKLQSELAALKEKVRSFDRAAEKNQQDLLYWSEQLEKLQGQKQVWEERKRHYTSNRSQYELELQQLGSRQQEEKEQLHTYRQSEQAAEKALAETKNELKRIEKKMNAGGLRPEDKLEQVKSTYFDLLNEKTAAANEIRYLEEQEARAEAAGERRKEANRTRLEERRRLQQEVERLEAAYQQTVDELASSRASWRQTKEQLDQLKQRLEKQESWYYEGLRHEEQLAAKQETLETMEQEYAGFQHGVKYILQQRDEDLSGIHGALAELIDVEEKYRTMVETALGGAQQHVVTENEASAGRAIELLRRRKKGRATFLPSDVVQPRTLRADDRRRAEASPSFLGTMNELVDADDAYTRVLQHALGNVIAAADLEGARELARSIQWRARIVTLEGDVISPGGAMSGGSVQQKKAPLLGRRKEIDKLAEDRKRLQEKLTEAESSVRSLKQEKAEAEQQLAELEETGEELNSREREAKKAFDELSLKVQSISDSLHSFDLESAEAEREAQERQQALHKWKMEKEKLEARLSQASEEIEQLNRHHEQMAVDQEELEQKLTELKIQAAKEEEQLSAAASGRVRLEASCQALEKEIREKDEARVLLEAELDEESGSRTTLDDQLQDAEKQKEACRTSASSIKAERDSAAEEERVKSEALSKMSGELKWAEEQFHQHEITANRLDVELDNRLQRLQEEYELSYEAAKNRYPLEMDTDTAKEKVKLLKRGIEELGDVNLGAVEEYARVKERYDFLHGQQSDLEEAKSTLTGIIEEMDEEMTSRFRETFNGIQSHFQEVFADLFGGGQASLTLTNPEDLLTTGVDIAAQPPGKKLQHLALLSGGERALTAIALLFSILKTRPVPFCVLDEVEAALDEANVNRFASFLKDFSKSTQFVVVTHRKGTMEQSDALYGVTMQESGVSSLVSVKLEETEALVQSGAVKEE